MCRVESSPCLQQPPPWPGGIAAPAPCPTAGLNEHRLSDRPVVLDLLGSSPGSVPYSTYLEIEAARSRLSHQSLAASIERLSASRVDYGRLAAEETGQEPVPAAPRCEARPHDTRTPPVVGFSLARRKWPLGGLIDLVV